MNTKDPKKIVRVIHDTFEIGVILKGIDAVLEIIGGFLLFFINRAEINNIILKLTSHELSEDPNDFIVNSLINAAHNVSVSGQFFSSVYLLSHGIIKIFIIISLLRRKLWAYPTGIIFFSLFAIYQIYRYTYTHSLWLILLTILDIVVIALTIIEYRNIKKLFGNK